MLVVQFSCGAASAVAAKLTLRNRSAENVLIVNAFIEEEHSDNRRFFEDCKKWFAHDIVTVRAEKFKASTIQVWTRKRFMKGPYGAPCSLELKRKPLDAICGPSDTKVIGFTADEAERADDLCEHFPDEKFAFPLIEENLTKQDCYAIVRRAGIELPMMYRLGYPNANCIGCPKGGQAYWQHIRKDFPKQFIQISDLQEAIGLGARFLRFRSGPRKGERMWLKELPEGCEPMAGAEDFTCSFFCDQTARGWRVD